MPHIANVLVTLHSDLQLSDAQKQQIEQSAPQAAFTYCHRDNLTPELMENAQIWVGNPSLGDLEQAKKLEFLQLCTAGADYYFSQPEHLPPHLQIATATGAFGLSIAEYITGGLLMLMRRMHIYRDQQHQNLWQRCGAARTIHGSTVLVVGLGNLGCEFAWRAKALGAYVIGLRRSGTQKPDYVDELHLTQKLDELLPRADVVALCLPGTAETTNMIDARSLSLMKQDSYLINVGRGSAVDSLALCQALQSGRLAGALIDVTSPEPLPQDHPLWLEQNVVITPHCSGGYDVGYTVDAVADIVTQNLMRYSAGESLLNVVDPQTGYRKLD